MSAIQDLRKQKERKNEILKDLLLNLNESYSNSITSLSPNIGLLVDLCAAEVGFNEIRLLSEAERHRFIRVLSKSINLLSLMSDKSNPSIILNEVKGLIYEASDLYTEISINNSPIAKNDENGETKND